jgi:threonine/homoserine/homoserine lactone efflux protein
MTVLSIPAFCVAMFILAATPGPGVFATVARSLASGFKATLPLIMGIILGDILYLLFAVFGLSIIARTMADLFMVIRLIGGGYLIYLGIRIWRSDPKIHILADNQHRSPRHNFFSGLVITLSNPKVILFYCAFLPTFVNLAGLGLIDIFVIALLVISLLGTVLCFYSLAAGQTRRFFNSTRAIRNLNRSAGTVMAATGIIIATRT